MSKQGKMDCGRRRLIIATAAVGGTGAVVALFRSSPACCLRARQGSRRTGRSRYRQTCAGSDDDCRMARQTGLDHQPDQGNAGTLPKLRRPSRRSQVRASTQPPYAARTNTARSSRSYMVVDRHLYPPWLLAVRQKFKAGAEDRHAGADWPGGFSAPATARPSISLAACSRTSRRRPISRCRRTCTFPIPSI